MKAKLNNRLESIEDRIYGSDQPNIPLCHVVIVFPDGCCSAQVDGKEIAGSLKRVQKKLAKRARKKKRQFYCVITYWSKATVYGGDSDAQNRKSKKSKAKVESINRL